MPPKNQPKTKLFRAEAFQSGPIGFRTCVESRVCEARLENEEHQLVILCEAKELLSPRAARSSSSASLRICNCPSGESLAYSHFNNPARPKGYSAQAPDAESIMPLG